MFIKPEKIKRQNLLFNIKKFGELRFYLVVTYTGRTIFYSFYAKAKNFPSKVFLFYKLSTGPTNRKNLNKDKKDKKILRGRFKKTHTNVFNVLIQMLTYIRKFNEIHSKNLMNFSLFNVIWKLKKYDYTIQKIMRYQFNINFRISQKEFGRADIFKKPTILHTLLFRFPHNGCRPPKARRLKRRRR